MRLENKIAIITGAAGGMGAAGALLFARERAKVAVVDITEERAQLTVDAIRAEGGEAIAIGADITKTDDVLRIVERTITELGLPNVLFNNAGVDLEHKAKMIDVDEDIFDAVINVNLKGPWLMMKHVVPKMIQAGGGSIINTASTGAFIPVSSAAYCASKAGVVMLTKVAANELGKHGIRANTLNPGATTTPMADQQREEMLKRGIPAEQLDAAMAGMSVLGRFGKPEEVAQMALFLASDDSSNATGADFFCDGGLRNIGATYAMG